MNETAVLVFGKSPRPGTVKTRLVPGLSACQAADLYRWMLDRALAAACESGLGPVTLWAWPDTECPQLRQMASRHGVNLMAQSGPDLGARMRNAIAHALAHYPGALLMGSDCPALDAGRLRQAATALERDKTVVLVPAVDGGYVLVGMRHPCDEMFDEVPWGTAGVLSATRERLRSAGRSWTELAPLRDVDRVQDLDLLPVTLSSPPAAPNF